MFLTVYSSQYKGSAKCWVAKSDPAGKIISFLEPISIKRDRYEVEKEYELLDGNYYIYNTIGTKKWDRRVFCKIENGEIIILREDYR